MWRTLERVEANRKKDVTSIFMRPELEGKTIHLREVEE